MRDISRILVVEDDFVSRRILQKILSEFGDVDIAINGREAVEAFKLGYRSGRAYHLIILDIMMPEMSGTEALTEMRRLEEGMGIQGNDRVKIVMATAVSERQQILGSFSTGCDGYIIKPYDKEKIVSKLADNYIVLKPKQS